jgi:acyl carrier protein
MLKGKGRIEIQEWLIDRVSTALKVKGNMDPDAPFSRYGLQSIDAVVLAMEIEDETGIEFPPTLLWEYPTVNECVSFLVKVVSEEAA